jgi:3-methyladenine DNA glycosylase/8-oxoguanine DNA glycosylase
MRALREPDAFPSSDLGLLKASAISTSRELEQRSEPWRPWRAYAAMFLWRMGGKRRSVRPDRKGVEAARQEVSELEQIAL